MIEVIGKYSTARVMTDEDALPKDEFEQATKFVNCSVFNKDSVIMPDYHWGAGCMIGFTSELTDKVIPNVIGVDIGCNMLYVDFGMHIPWDIAKRATIDKLVRDRIPMAFNHHSRPRIRMEQDFQWALSTLAAQVFASKLNSKFDTEYKSPAYTSKWFFDVCDRINIKPNVAVNSLGSLGGGNHFIEFSNSIATGHTGVTLHSGSRGFGNKVASYWQKKAKARMKEHLGKDMPRIIEIIKENNPKSRWDDLIKASKKLYVPTGLEYLEGQDWFDYLMEMNFAQIYAHVNLNIMMQIILDTLGLKEDLMLGRKTTHTIHNYISPDDLIIRKGAVRSIKGRRMLIPANMEDGILVAEGMSNEEWNCSAPHGAGRLFGRKVMKQRKDIDVGVIRDRMAAKDIYTSVLPKDEVKEAYKDIAFIERVIKPTATVVDKLVPIMNIKADD